MLEGVEEGLRLQILFTYDGKVFAPLIILQGVG